MNDDLFQLIKAMSKTEKRYFKLDAQKNTKSNGDKKSNTIQLFDAINNMEEYKEEKLLKKSFVKNLSEEKNMLYGNILKSIRAYRSKNSHYAQIKEMIIEAKYLLEMGLQDQCRKMLKKAKKLAYQMEDHLSILEINQKERHLTKLLRNKKLEKELKDLQEENRQVLHFINEEMEVARLIDLLFFQIFQKHNLKDAISRDILNEKIVAFDIDEHQLQSTHAKNHFYLSKVIYHTLVGENEKAIEYQLKTIEWWNDHPKNKKENFIKYLNSMANLIGLYFELDQYDRIPPLLDELIIDKKHNRHEKSTIFYTSSLYKLLYFLNTANFEEASILVEDIEKGFELYQLSEVSKIILIANTVTLCFIKEDFENCIVWLQKMLKNRKTQDRQDIQQAYRILKMIALYELEEVDALANEIRAIDRFFNLHTNLKKDNFEVIAFGYLKNIYGADLYQKKQFLQEFHDYLQKLNENPNEKKSAGFEELFLWVKSRVNNSDLVYEFKLFQQNKAS